MPNPDYFGPDGFPFQVSDGVLAPAAATIDITVEPVNDPPSFELGDSPDQAVYGNATFGASRFATDISPGPPNESDQAVSFVVSNDNPALFDEQPAIDSNGNLAYTVAADQAGVATVTVELVDNGGTANGGYDSSPTRSFQITILESPPDEAA